jgi:hypothetical protein
LLANLPAVDAPSPRMPLPFDELRWFWLPEDALEGAGAAAPTATPTCPPAARRVGPVSATAASGEAARPARKGGLPP